MTVVKVGIHKKDIDNTVFGSRRKLMGEVDDRNNGAMAATGYLFWYVRTTT
jgi:hypothetical protein